MSPIEMEKMDNFYGVRGGKQYPSIADRQRKKDRENSALLKESNVVMWSERDPNAIKCGRRLRILKKKKLLQDFSFSCLRHVFVSLYVYVLGRQKQDSGEIFMSARGPVFSISNHLHTHWGKEGLTGALPPCMTSSNPPPSFVLVVFWF